MTQRLVSVCCEAEPTDEIVDGAGRCSRCKENAMFEPDTWTQESEGPCGTCHGEVGHRVNCPEGIAFSKHAPAIGDPMAKTNKQTHTPGKRVVRGTRVGVIDQRDGVLIMTAKAFSGTGSTLAEQEANARHIAACENACWNIPTEALEAGVVADLLVACESIARLLSQQGFPLPLIMKAAIAKAKGESQ